MEFETLSYFLYGLAIIFLGVGIFLPIGIISKFSNNLINNNPSVLIVPIYFAIVLLTFSTMSYIVAILLKKPSKDSMWVAKVSEVLGTILIIIGIITFFVIVSESTDSILPLQNLGIIGGAAVLAFHCMLGTLCIGLSGIHSKYNADSPLLPTVLNTNNESEFGSKFCSNCGSRVTDGTIIFCEECGTKL